MSGPIAKAYPRETQQHVTLRDAIWARLNGWHRFVVAVDGVDGAGKTTLARYLAWQLGMPAIETDLYLQAGAEGLLYDEDRFEAAVQSRLRHNRPAIVEGVRVLKLLSTIGVAPDYLVWVEQEDWPGTVSLSADIAAYEAEYSPRQKADSTFLWQSDFEELAE